MLTFYSWFTLNAATVMVCVCSVGSGLNPSTFQWEGERTVAGGCKGGGVDTSTGGAEEGSGDWCQGSAATDPLPCGPWTWQIEAWAYGMSHHSVCLLHFVFNKISSIKMFLPSPSHCFDKCVNMTYHWTSACVSYCHYKLYFLFCNLCVVSIAHLKHKMFIVPDIL